MAALFGIAKVCVTLSGLGISTKIGESRRRSPTDLVDFGSPAEL
jgi:hypothetical protein